MDCEQVCLHHSIPALEIQTQQQIIHNCLPYEYINRQLHDLTLNIIFYKMSSFHHTELTVPVIAYLHSLDLLPEVVILTYLDTSSSHQASGKALFHMLLSLQQVGQYLVLSKS